MCPNGLKRGDYTSHSAEETEQIGRLLGQNLEPGSIVCFFGELGTGKTTLIRGLVGDSSEVSSPTFVYLNIYGRENRPPLYHFDLYRLRDLEDFLAMGFEELLFGEGICLIEWAERIESLLPSSCIQVRITHEGGDKRSIHIKG